MNKTNLFFLREVLLFLLYKEQQKISTAGSRDLLFTHVFLFAHFLQAIAVNSQDSYILCYLNSKVHALFIYIYIYSVKMASLYEFNEIAAVLQVTAL